MRQKFDQETAQSAVAVNQLIAEWGYELDINNGTTITDLLTTDCKYAVGGTVFNDHAGIKQFYAARNERVRTQQKDGVRTQRHSITNQVLSFPDRTHATATFTLVNYSAGGKPPIMDLVGPTIIADVRMAFRREADGLWRIAEFDSTPVFIGNDPFLNASVVKK